MVRVREEKRVTCYPQPVEEGDEEVLANALYIKPDGRTVRFVSPSAPSLPAHADFVNGVASRDVTDMNTENGLWARIFVPESVAKKGPDAKAPILVFFHGGGFAVGSPDFSIFDVLADHCEAAARISEVVVISMSYRLAPEHRLPAAYEDAFTAIRWLQKQAERQAKGEAEPWLQGHADFSACFVMGESAGGNIVHHLALQLAKTDLRPLSIKGLIFLVPWLAKEERTESELIHGAIDTTAPLALLDRFWELALPVGANRDHPYSNVFGPGEEMPNVAKALFIVGTEDPVYARQMEYFRAWKKAGRNVALLEVSGGGHGFRMLPRFVSQVLQFEQAIRAFIHEDAQ